MGTINVSNLGKAYKQYTSRWARLAEWILPDHKPRHRLHWVLQDINFAIEAGEAVGIIGINGAGKSTLLKMITGTTAPSAGQVHITGHVAALLELGMGFHPDFTGRENAYMAGQLLGYSVQDITQLMPEIEEFAEIGDYIDKPVRVYSSGMQVRLAFSVATAKRPDVLIVDEALSVGDAYFQHKSFDRIRKFRRLGTTLLIVSHDKQAIQSICDRAILLNAGRVAMEGEPEAVMDYYNALLAQDTQQSIKRISGPDGKLQTLSGSGEVSLLDVSLLNLDGQDLETIGVGDLVTLRIQAVVQEPIKSLVVGYMIKDRLGQVIFGTNTHNLQCEIKDLLPAANVTLDFGYHANIGPGTYSIAIALHSGATHISGNYEWRDRALIFNVVNRDKPDFIGTSWLQPALRYSV